MKQNAILLQIFLWYKVHYLVCTGGVKWSMWFIVIASSWIRQLRFGHLSLQHALVKGQGLSYSVLQESNGERHPLSVWQMTSQKRISACRPCIGLSLRSGWAVTSLENMTRCSHGLRLSGSGDLFAFEDGKIKFKGFRTSTAHRKTNHYYFSSFLLPRFSHKQIRYFFLPVVRNLLLSP